jgi:hypothetical protein
MLGDLGLGVLLFMLSMYALTVVYGLVFAIVYVVKKMGRLAVRTIAYIFLLGMTTALCATPFLKMHGSYSDTDRILIILFCLINIFLMVLFAVSRVIALSKAGNQPAQDTPTSNTNMDA